jgi:prolycopene isomerase
MPNLKKDQYDVIIVGAGIGGLVCGCYLARAGKKVLIVEKNAKPGGYCTSFERDGFRFDVGVHGLGEMYEGGRLRRIIDELELDIQITRIDPSDIIITPEYEVCFFNDLGKTIYNFQENFPKEAKNIEAFFNFVKTARIVELYRKLRFKTFEQLLDEFFKDQMLKKMLGVPLGNLGVSSKTISALVSTIFYRDFMINGGYYPIGGMQSLPDALLKRFKEFGGEVLLSKKIEKIIVKNNTVKGVIIEQGHFLKSKYVVSNCDARQLFFELIGKEHISKKFIKIINKMIPTASVFLVYLGLKDDLSSLALKKCSALWYPSSNMDKVYLHNSNIEDIDYLQLHLLCSLAEIYGNNDNKKSMHLLIMVPFRSEKFWDKCKGSLSNDMIERIEQVVPSLSSCISLKIIATPFDLYRYTLNYKGAVYGWAAFPSQANFRLIPSKTEINNLFLCGHWITHAYGQSGISTVAYSGYRTSQFVLKNDNQVIKY